MTKTPAQNLYLKSQKELEKGEFEQAYHDYQSAITAEPNLKNTNHLSSILYAWVISQSEAEYIPLLNAQKQVLLKPQQLAFRRELLSIAVDNQKGIIRAFGIGVAPQNTADPEQRRLLARKAALADSQAWVARLARWAATGVDNPFNVSQAVKGLQTHNEYWIKEVIYVVEARAPIDCLS